MSESTVGTVCVCVCVYVFFFALAGMTVPGVPLGISLSGFQGNIVLAAQSKMGHNLTTKVVLCNRRQYQTLPSDVHR